MTGPAQTILVAAGVHRLATSLRSGDPAIGPWALLAFALSQSFARLADARGTVVVVPLASLGLAVAAGLVHPPDGGKGPGATAEAGKTAEAGMTAEAATTGDAPHPEDRWRIGRGTVIGLALGSATLVHPVIGFFAIVTVGVVALLRPRELAPDAAVAGVTAGLIALPQLATMVGLSLPTLALGIGLPIAIVVSVAVGRAVERSDSIRRGLIRVAQAGRVVLPLAAIAILLGAVAVSLLELDKLPAAAGMAAGNAWEASGLLLATLVVGATLGSRGAWSPLVIVGLTLGVVVVLLVNLLPDKLGFLGDALRFEVPKTVYYWLSSIAAAGAAPALAFIWWRASLPWLGRVALVAAFVITAALPRFEKPANAQPGSGDGAALEPIDAYHLGEHRWSETLAIDLHFADSGFWLGFPDSRTVVNPPRQEILDALRAEIDAGRLVHDTPVLHLARSFQQWVATPLGVFDGVDETFVSLDPEVSHQTVGGRLHGLEELPGFLASREFAYLVLEPEGLPDGMREQVLAAGYEPIFANDQGEVFRLP
jgi:hypothetical protein